MWIPKTIIFNSKILNNLYKSKNFLFLLKNEVKSKVFESLKIIS